MGPTLTSMIRKDRVEGWERERVGSASRNVPVFFVFVGLMTFSRSSFCFHCLGLAATIGEKENEALALRSIRIVETRKINILEGWKGKL